MRGRVLTVRASIRPLRVVEIERHAAVVRTFLASLDGEIVDAALVGHGEPHFLDREREEMNCSREFPHVMIPVLAECKCFVEGSLAVAECGDDHLFAGCGHGGSPLNVAPESTSGVAA